jgi:peptide/nickel transport system permease protein
MIGFLIRRTLQGALTILLVTAVVFFLVNLAPGGPGSIMRPDMTAAERHALTLQMGLDKPVVTRYATWLGSAIRGDLGMSLSNSLPVSQEVGERFPNTAVLALLTLVISVTVGIVLGVVAAQRRGSWVDHVIGFVSVAGLSVPVFWFAILLILLFSVDLSWLPSSGMSSNPGFDLHDRIMHLIMPVTVLALTTLPNIIRFARSSMLEALSQDYVRTARAKGLPEVRVLYIHVLRNALIPVLATVGVLVPRLLGGALITETVFGWPGMGQLMFTAASSRDYPMVMGITVVIAVAVVVVNIAVDALYSLVDARIRVS